MKARYKLLAFLMFVVISIGACLRLNQEMIPSNFDKEMANIKEVRFQLEIPYVNVGYYTEKIYNDDIEKLSMLYNESDVVVKGKATAKKQDSQIIQSTVEITDVLYGKVEEDKIIVIEQAAMIDSMVLIIDGGSVTPMIYEKEYLLFLKKNKDYASGNVYRLTSMLFGKYPAQDGLNAYEADYPRLIHGDEGIFEQGCSKDVLSYDVAFFNPINIKAYESGEFGLEDEYSKGRYQALIMYRDTFKTTYLKFYNELKQDGLII